MDDVFNVGLLGATGMVGQNYLDQLSRHPWFRVRAVAASPRSAGKTYAQAVSGRWVMSEKIPQGIGRLKVRAVDNIDAIRKQVDFVFSAIDLGNDEIRELEGTYAALGIPVISNNSAHRWTRDVPMIIPEINPDHTCLIKAQRRNRGWDKGLIAVKPNCSLQSFLIAVYALKEFEPRQIIVTTLQAISGAGKTFETYPEINDNVIPFIRGEEEKTEQESLQILGHINKQGRIILPRLPKISAHCNRVNVSDGHLAAVSISFKKKPTQKQILKAWQEFVSLPQELLLPSAPHPCIIYRQEDDRPQTKLDRMAGNGMAVSVGRLRPCNVLDYRFVCLSHNTIRGAAGGAIEMAELLVKKGYITKK